MEATANLAGAGLIGQYLVNGEEQQQAHRSNISLSKSNPFVLRSPTLEEIALIGQINVGIGSQASITTFLSVDSPSSLESENDDNNNDKKTQHVAAAINNNSNNSNTNTSTSATNNTNATSQSNKKRKAEEVFDEYENVLKNSISKDAESLTHFNNLKAEYEKMRTILRSLRRKLSSYTSPSKRNSTISQRQTLGTGRYEIERKEKQEKIKVLEENLDTYFGKIVDVEKRLEIFQNKNKNRIKQHRIFVQQTTRKMELEEVLKSIQVKLNDTQEKVKDAEAILISYETPLPRHNKDNEFDTSKNHKMNVSTKNIEDMSKEDCLKEIEHLKNICNVHKEALLNDENRKKIFLAKDSECIKSVKAMENAENEIVTIDQNVKLACDTYDSLRSQANNIIYDEANKNKMIVAMRILHQNGGAMMMNDFKEEIRTRIEIEHNGNVDKNAETSNSNQQAVNAVQLVYTLLANRLVQFDRSNGTEVFSLLL
jgi:hypothetical protein